MLADLEVILESEIVYELNSFIVEYLFLKDDNYIAIICSLMSCIASWAGFLSTDAMSGHMESIIGLEPAEGDIYPVIRETFKNEALKALQDYPPRNDYGVREALLDASKDI